MKRLLPLAFVLIFSAHEAQAQPAQAQPAKPPTTKAPMTKPQDVAPVAPPVAPVVVESLGQPMAERFASRIYARNVWDMQFFDGRLYIGTGNSSNAGPHSNAGPVPIWSMNAKGEWKTEFTIDDEQIDVFRVLDGKLTIPGHDPRDDWSKGNYYQLQADGWKKTRAIPNGIHTYDMAFFANRLWGALGTQGDFQLASSGDGGQTWQTYPMTTGRTYTLLEFENRLLGWGMLPSAQVLKRISDMKDEKARGESQKRTQWSTYEVAAPIAPALEPVTTPRADLTTDALFPGAPADIAWAKLVRPIVFSGQLLYIGGAVFNDHQTDPFGAYVAASLRLGKVQSRRIALGADEKPWDIAVHNSRAYLLTSRKIAREGASDEYEIKVWSSRDAKTWTQSISFTQPTFARAFALHGSDILFGLGTDVGAGFEKQGLVSYTRDLRPEAGTILRVRNALGALPLKTGK